MLKTIIAAGALATAAAAFATPIALQGNYIRVGISDYGTLGSNGNNSPGLIHDPTGTGNFGVNDYITPGSPHEGFALVSDQFGFSQNDNNGAGAAFGFTSPTLLAGAAAEGFDNAASWTGGLDGLVTLTNSYFFNDGDERILIRTSVTALADLTNLRFVRSVDPDPDVNTFGSFDTDNRRGNDFFDVRDFVGAAGDQTGLTLALINLNGTRLTRNTGIGFGCCNTLDPDTVLAGGELGDAAFGDYSLNLAYLLGDLRAGQTVSFSYAYAVGENIDTVGGVPEPATWAMMILGFGMVGASMRRRRAGVVAAA